MLKKFDSGSTTITTSKVTLNITCPILYNVLVVNRYREFCGYVLRVFTNNMAIEELW